MAQVQSGTGQWTVNIQLTGPGSSEWDTLAKAQFHALIAMDLDGQVISAPVTQPTDQAFTSFGGQVEISGSFTENQAKNLATELNYGSLPVKLNQITVQTVSPTLGKSSLKAGLISGLAGLALVLLYMVFYYRLLGLVVISGLAITGALLWVIIAFMGHSFGTTIDLAGIIGIIVSVGITVDSYIVYFERLKDEARAGRTVRSSVDKGFRSAFRTVLAADAVSFLGAAILYEISIGPVPRLRPVPGPVDHHRRRHHLLLHQALCHPARSTPNIGRNGPHGCGPRTRRGRRGCPMSPRSGRNRPGQRGDGDGPLGDDELGEDGLVEAELNEDPDIVGGTDSAEDGGAIDDGGFGGEDGVGPDKRPNVLLRLFRGGTSFDFIGKRKWWFAISAIIIVAGVVSIGTRGLNLGIDFKGGQSWTVSNTELTVAQATTVAENAGVNQPTVVLLTNQLNHTKSVEVQADLNSKPQAERQAIEQKVESGLANAAHISVNDVSFSDVGATWGGQVTSKAIEALIVFFIAVVIYISVRFEFKMAVAALVAVIHDLLVTAGVYSLTGLPSHPGHGHRRADRARVLVVRHSGRLRPNSGEREGPRHVGTHHLFPDRQPVHEPDPGPIDQHVPGGHRPRAVGARGGLAPARGDDARGLRSGSGHRADQRRLLLDLHRLASARHHEGT